MKRIRKTIMLMLGILIAGALTSNAQNFQGIATYQSSRKIGNISTKGVHMSPEDEKQIMRGLKKQSQKEYELKFNLTESIWAEAESLAAAQVNSPSAGAVVSSNSSYPEPIIYKNMADNLYLYETESWDKLFLVESQLKNREWKLTNETKRIGNYNAQKATLIEIVHRNVISFDNDDSKEKISTDTVKIEAWYTPEIPVSNGPDKFWGLPGLIMEVSDGKTTFLCTKVILNPKGGVTIKKPFRGEKVSPEEFKKISGEKTKEMMKKFNHKKIGGN